MPVLPLGTFAGCWVHPRSAAGRSLRCPLMSAPNAPSPARPLRARRSCLAVPGSNPRMLQKAQGLPADQVFLDLEDSVAPLAKEDARGNVVAALTDGDWSG